VHLHLLPGGRSFIGLPANGAGVDAGWLWTVTQQLLDRHERLLVLLESELMSYECGANLGTDMPVLRPAVTADLVTEDTMERWREVDEVRHALPGALSNRIQVASWAHFIDPSFAAIWRHLLTAFAVARTFRSDVVRLGQVRGRVLNDNGAAEAARAACLHQVEALAMRLRISEVAGYHNEYGVGADGVLAERLYAGAYAVDGLTVESLVGHPARRVYSAL
jgi:hypothetical protein